jgi:hypothetical protein
MRSQRSAPTGALAPPVPTQAEMARDELAALDAVERIERAQQRKPAVQAGPRCGLPRPTPRPPAGPPIEPPVTRVDNATWQHWQTARRQRIDARPPPRDARRAVAVALNAEHIDQGTASATCPRCHGVLAIRFRGELIDLDCCDGCPPGDVQRAAGVVA